MTRNASELICAGIYPNKVYRVAQLHLVDVHFYAVVRIESNRRINWKVGALRCRVRFLVLFAEISGLCRSKIHLWVVQESGGVSERGGRRCGRRESPSAGIEAEMCDRIFPCDIT